MNPASNIGTATGLKRLAKSLLPTSILERRRKALGGIVEFAFDHTRSVREDIATKYGSGGDLLDIYSGNNGPVVHKWHHYIPIYDRYFAPFRGRPIRFLEIGVSKGGSLQLWRKYFGSDAVIFGIDIDPSCARFNGEAGQVRIGSQTDATFLRRVIEEMGGVDVVLDDGSHQMAHIRTTLNILFPLVEPGGIYMIEDLHCAYWKLWGGGIDSKANFFRYIGELIADMHSWYHTRQRRHPDISGSCGGIHVHDSVCVLDKAVTFPPVHSHVGEG